MNTEDIVINDILARCGGIIETSEDELHSIVRKVKETMSLKFQSSASNSHPNILHIKFRELCLMEW